MRPDEPHPFPNALRVVDNRPQDFALGRARIDEPTRLELGLEPGDFITVEGARPTLAVVLDAPLAPNAQGVIQLDYLQRKNCGARIDDRVRVESIEAVAADRVDLRPIQPTPGDPARRLLPDPVGLVGRPLLHGDLVVLPHAPPAPAGLGLYLVAATDPAGAIHVAESTTIQMIA